MAAHDRGLTMANPNHDEKTGQFSSGESAGAPQQTFTQVHQFRTRGNVHLKPAVKTALGSRGGGGGGGGGGSGGGGGRLTSAARERKKLNQALDARGWPGGQAQGESGNETTRALQNAPRKRR